MSGRTRARAQWAAETEFLLSGVLFLFTRGSAALAAQGCGRAHRWWQMRFAVQRALCHVMSAARLHKDGGMAAAGDSGGDSGPHLVAFCRRPLNHTHSTHLLSRRDTHNKCI